MQYGHGVKDSEGDDGVSSKEILKPNSNVIINPYRKIANEGRVEQAATVRNPYKKACSRNKADVTLQHWAMSNKKVRKNLSGEHAKCFCEPHVLTHSMSACGSFRE